MTNIPMPEPAAWLRSDELRKLGRPYSDSPLNQRTDSMLLHAKGTAEAAKKYGHDVSVITTTQAEAYADARVREALEQAADICAGIAIPTHRDAPNKSAALECAIAIRALMPQQ